MNKAIVIGWINQGKPCRLWGDNEEPTDDTQVGRTGSEVQMRRLQELEKASLGVFTVDLEFGNT